MFVWLIQFFVCGLLQKCMLSLCCCRFIHLPRICTTYNFTHWIIRWFHILQAPLESIIFYKTNTVFLSIGFILPYNSKKWSLRGILQVIINHTAALLQTNYLFFPCLKMRNICRHFDYWKAHVSWQLRTAPSVLIDSNPCSKTP